jgi:hypothetical protein
MTIHIDINLALFGVGGFGVVEILESQVLSGASCEFLEPAIAVAILLILLIL